jgi:hypothetical protein
MMHAHELRACVSLWQGTTVVTPQFAHLNIDMVEQVAAGRKRGDLSFWFERLAHPKPGKCQKSERTSL